MGSDIVIGSRAQRFGVGGILGTLLTGVFASNALGVFSGKLELDIVSQVGIQGVGVAVTLVYTAVVTGVILWVTNALVGNRVSDENELEGLDIVSHNEQGYDL